MKEQSQRQLRVGQQIRHELACQFLRGHFVHPALQRTTEITVSEVTMSPDLKNARAYVMHLGDDRLDKDMLKALNEIAPKIQGEIARNLGLRSTPRLRFEEDEAFANAQRLNAVLSTLKTSE